MKKQDAAVIKVLSDIGFSPEPELSIEQEQMLERALDPEKEFLYKVEKLFEAVFETDEIVDYVYDEAFARYINEAERAMKGKEVNRKKFKLTPRLFSSEELADNIQDEKVQDALKKNPIEILAGSFDSGSNYVPADNKITVSFNNEIYGLFARYNYDYDRFLEAVPRELHKNLENELNGNKTKNSIAHEVSHWMDDTFNNKHLTKMTNKIGQGVSPKERTKLSTRNTPDVYMADYEINAMIHGIAQSKRKYADKWDTFTINDLFNIDPALNTLRKEFKGTSKEKASQFMRLIIQRMNRENLLGKNMTGTFAI